MRDRPDRPKRFPNAPPLPSRQAARLPGRAGGRDGDGGSSPRAAVAIGCAATGRRGVHLIETMVVLSIIGVVLSAVAMSVAATQRSLDTIHEQAMDVATLQRLAQQLREDVHRAVAVPAASGRELEIERLDGVVLYRTRDGHLVRRFESPAGRAQATFEIPLGDEAWAVLRDEGVVRLAWDAPGGKEIVAAWRQGLDVSDSDVEETP